MGVYVKRVRWDVADGSGTCFVGFGMGWDGHEMWESTR